MKLKIFTTDTDGNIKITKKDLESLLNEAYWEGYNANTYKTSWGVYCNTQPTTGDTITIPSWTSSITTTTLANDNIKLYNNNDSASIYANLTFSKDKDKDSK